MNRVLPGNAADGRLFLLQVSSRAILCANMLLQCYDLAHHI